MSSVNGPSSANTTIPVDQNIATQQTQSGNVATTNINLNDNAVAKETSNLLNQLGLDSANVVKDTVSIGKTAEVSGLSNAEQVYGTGETKLAAPAPPRVELTAELATGAESFATNVGMVVDDVVKTMVANNQKTDVAG